jgi:hypothetical protein
MFPFLCQGHDPDPDAGYRPGIGEREEVLADNRVIKEDYIHWPKIRQNTKHRDVPDIFLE